MKNLHKIDTVLFDMDGTLVDTETLATKGIKTCFEKWNINIDPQDIDFIIGRTWDLSCDFLFKKYALPLSQADAKKQLLADYRKRLENELILVPGSVSTVQSLTKSFKMGLVSGSIREDVLWILGKMKITECFQVILGAEDYPRSKPEPDGYLKALKSLKSQAKRGLVFEDSTAGIASAQAAGLWVIAITSTNHFQQDVSSADFQIPDFQKVNPHWIQNLPFLPKEELA